MLIAEFRDRRVFPGDFPNDLYTENTCAEHVEDAPLCPECGGRVTYVKQSSDGRTAHFRHCTSGGAGSGNGAGDGCGGSSVGESDEHRALKSIAVSAAERLLTTVGIARSRLEVEVTAPVSDAEHRQADCLLEFENQDDQLGEGLIIEVQYRNKTKDIEATFEDYLGIEKSYSVLWLHENDFDTESDSPEDWTCSIETERELRHTVRRQLWPSNNTDCLWGEIWGANRTDRARVDGHHIDHNNPTEDYIREVSESSEESGCSATFATDVVDWIAQQIKSDVEWGSLFSPSATEEYFQHVVSEFNLPSSVVPVQIPEHVLRGMQHAQSVEDQLPPSHVPDRPPNPFDDLQCWNCGTYWLADSGEEYCRCPDCDEPVDFEWNLRTGRISELPAYVDTLNEQGESTDSV